MDRLPDIPGERLAPALFLDFDGTLAPIARRPEEVKPDPRLPSTLERLQRALDGALAIITGRPLEQIDAMLTPLRLPGAGAHGVERRDLQGAMKRREDKPPPKLVEALAELARREPGLRLEFKPATVALHYREAPQLENVCLVTARDAVKEAKGWVVQRGKCVVEIRPHDVTKGRTIAWFMGNRPFVGRTPVFVGDDDADEDGFAVVQAAGGFGVKVGNGATAARLRLDAPGDVLRWLERLAGKLELDAGSAGGKPAP
jgi:trehalose 6-phosphate phosphatase